VKKGQSTKASWDSSLETGLDTITGKGNPEMKLMRQKGRGGHRPALRVIEKPEGGGVLARIWSVEQKAQDDRGGCLRSLKSGSPRPRPLEKKSRTFTSGQVSEYRQKRKGASPERELKSQKKGEGKINAREEVGIPRFRPGKYLGRGNKGRTPTISFSMGEIKLRGRWEK